MRKTPFGPHKQMGFHKSNWEEGGNPVMQQSKYELEILSTTHQPNTKTTQV